MIPTKAKATELRIQQDTSDAIKAIGSALLDPAKQRIELYCVFRDYLEHEDGLINNRLNWNFTIQGFLFAAYSFSLQKIADVRIALLQQTVDPNRIAPLHVFHTMFDLQFLVATLALAGAIVSALVYVSVRAARIAIHEVQDQWFEIERSGKPTDFDWWAWLRVEFFNTKEKDTSVRTHGKEPPFLPGLIGGGHQGADWLGFHAPTWLPLSITFIWVALFIDAVPDLFR